jgi:long-chain acyl-CoA synthetase
LWTNDLVRATENGLTLQGRRSRFINVAGNKVDPVEVEYAMKAMGALEEVVVIGADDAIKTQRVVAYVKPLERHSFCATELRQRLLAELAAYKVPEAIHVVESIPRNSLGKVLIAQIGQVEA